MKVYCKLHGEQDPECITCARMDLKGMREFQFKFLKADQALRQIAAVQTESKQAKILQEIAREALGE